MEAYRCENRQRPELTASGGLIGSEESDLGFRCGTQRARLVVLSADGLGTSAIMVTTVQAIWKADPDDIIAARNRGFQKLESILDV
jgi:predicted phosphoribosyltransferase